MRFYFRDEGHWYAKCLFDNLTIYPKCHRFHFFSRGIPMYIPILRGVQNEHISRLKDSVFLLKNVFFNLLFCDKGHMCANCLFDILTFYPKFPRFHFFSPGIRMYIPILTGFQNGHISGLKDSAFLLKDVLFEASFL